MNISREVRWQLWIVAVAFFMEMLDVTIVNTALPSISGTSRCYALIDAAQVERFSRTINAKVLQYWDELR